MSHVAARNGSQEGYNPPDPPSVAQLLPYIDFRSLPPGALQSLREIGPDLIDARMQSEIAASCGRRKDWARGRVIELRIAILEQARERLDEMPTRLRAHVLELLERERRYVPADRRAHVEIAEDELFGARF